ncbi:MAG: hypothetical protein AAFY44_15685, partial [Pseudomonadota bacterium]
MNSQELPDGIAFALILGQLSSIEPTVAKRLIVGHIGGDEASAAEFLGKVLSENQRLNSSIT